MYLVTYKGTQTLINQLMPGQHSLAVELRGHDQRAEMSIIITLDLYISVAKTGFNELLYFCWIHNDGSSSLLYAGSSGARSVTAKQTASQCPVMFVYYSRPALIGWVASVPWQPKW